MAIVKFDRKIFEKEIGKLKEDLQNKIAEFGTTVENLNEKEIELEIFPNRPDLLSYYGYKRAFLAFLGKNKGLKSYKVYPPEKDYEVNISSSVKEVRPYTVCAIVKKLKLNDERIKDLIELQEKLHKTLGRDRKKLAIGVYPLEKIKFPITFKALEPDKIKFSPLGYNREMDAIQILNQHPTGKKYGKLLAGKMKFPIFIDSNQQILSMPPIINSELIGKLTIKTNAVFIECSGFDFKILNKCLNILTTSLAEMGGKIYQLKLNYSKQKITPDLSSEDFKISLEHVNKLLGLSLREKEMNKLLEKMGYSYDKGIVKVPAWRTDILHEVDLIEDIAIAFGYENFSPELPAFFTIGEEDRKETLKNKIREILVGLNMLEVLNYHLSNSKEQFLKMGLSKFPKELGIEIKNSKTDYDLLRTRLTPSLMKVFSENSASEFPQRIFELGKIFYKEKTLEGKIEIIERESLAVAISPGNFTEIKQIANYLFKSTGLKLKFKESKDPPLSFVKGRIAELFLEDFKIGFLGEIQPSVLEKWNIKMPIALFEINLENLLKKLN